MGFERFTQVGKRFVPRVSIWKKGQMSFNQGAIERAGLESYKCVVLFYDKDSSKIGFKFTNDESEAGCIKYNVRNNTVRIGAKSFLEYYNIHFGETTQYDLFHDEIYGLWFIDLSQK